LPSSNRKKEDANLFSRFLRDWWMLWGRSKNSPQL